MEIDYKVDFDFNVLNIPVNSKYAWYTKRQKPKLKTTTNDANHEMFSNINCNSAFVSIDKCRNTSIDVDKKQRPIITVTIL